MRNKKFNFYSASHPIVYLIVNRDLKMGTGKIISQCSHAIFQLANELQKNEYINAKKNYLNEGQPKIVLKGTTNDLCEIYGKLRLTDIYCTYIKDAGRTQIKSGSLTVLLVFGDKENIKEYVGHLKLF